MNDDLSIYGCQAFISVFNTEDFLFCKETRKHEFLLSTYVNNLASFYDQNKFEPREKLD